MTTCIHWHSVITNCRSTRNKGNEPNSLWVGRHGVQGPLRPEMRKLFLRISREDCQPLSAIAHHCKQPPTIVNHCKQQQTTHRQGGDTVTRRIVVCSWRSFTRNPDRFPFIFRQGQNRRRLGDTLGDLSPLPNIVPN